MLHVIQQTSAGKISPMLNHGIAPSPHAKKKTCRVCKKKVHIPVLCWHVSNDMPPQYRNKLRLHKRAKSKLTEVCVRAHAQALPVLAFWVWGNAEKVLRETPPSGTTLLRGKTICKGKTKNCKGKSRRKRNIL